MLQKLLAPAPGSGYVWQVGAVLCNKKNGICVANSEYHSKHEYWKGQKQKQPKRVTSYHLSYKHKHLNELSDREVQLAFARYKERTLNILLYCLLLFSEVNLLLQRRFVSYGSLLLYILGYKRQSLAAQ